MAQTPLSGSASYLSAARFFLYRDERPVLELLSDDDQKATRSDAEDDTADAGAVLNAALQWASGEVERWCLPGNRYKPEDLAALTGNSLVLLEGLVADLAFWRLAKRRWPRVKEDEVSGAADAMQTLRDLRAGETIFGLTESANAGISGAVTLDSGTNREVVRYASRYFGSRLNRDS